MIYSTYDNHDFIETAQNYYSGDRAISQTPEKHYLPSSLSLAIYGPTNRLLVGAIDYGQECSSQEKVTHLF